MLFSTHSHWCSESITFKLTTWVPELNQPFQIEDFWVILRLESLIEAKLDKNMQLILSKELADEYLSKKTKEEVIALKTKYSLN